MTHLRFALLLAAAALASSAPPNHAQSSSSAESAVAVLFRGASTSSNSTGMHQLRDTLHNAFGDNLRSSVVPNRKRPYGFVRTPSHVGPGGEEILLFGHSAGAQGALIFGNRLRRSRRGGRDVALLVQLDRSSGRRVRENIRQAYHFWEPPHEGRMRLSRGQDFDVERLFDDTGFSHSNIDNDARIHAMLVWLSNRAFRPPRLNLQMVFSPSDRKYEGRFLEAVAAEGDLPPVCYEARSEITVAGKLKKPVRGRGVGKLTTFEISPGAEVDFRSGGEIRLLTGFRALEGSEVSARAEAKC